LRCSDLERRATIMPLSSIVPVVRWTAASSLYTQTSTWPSSGTFMLFDGPHGRNPNHIDRVTWLLLNPYTPHGFEGCRSRRARVRPWRKNKRADRQTSYEEMAPEMSAALEDRHRRPEPWRSDTFVAFIAYVALLLVEQRGVVLSKYCVSI
jgi:hypothetical protein